MDEASQPRNSDGSTGKDGTKHQERIEETRPADNEHPSSNLAHRDGTPVSERSPQTGGSGGWWNRSQAGTYSHTHFKVYRRRWFGLAQLVLLNVVVSWDVSRQPMDPNAKSGM